MEQNENYLIVLALDIVVMDELQEFSHLIRFDCLSGNTVVYHNTCKLKSERILHNQVIIYGHLEGGSQNTTDCFYGAVSLAVLLQLDEKELHVGYLTF